jgi:hypothetical protein
MTYNRPDLLAGAALIKEDSRLLEAIRGKLNQANRRV